MIVAKARLEESFARFETAVGVLSSPSIINFFYPEYKRYYIIGRILEEADSVIKTIQATAKSKIFLDPKVKTEYLKRLESGLTKVKEHLYEINPQVFSKPKKIDLNNPENEVSTIISTPDPTIERVRMLQARISSL